MKDAFVLFEELKNMAIAEKRTDHNMLSELLDTIYLQLKQTKSSEFLDRLYTASLYYSYLPRHNKRTYPEIRVKAVSMGMSGTDAMLLIEMLAMRVKSKDYAQTDEYKTAADRLFTSYTMSPGKVSASISRTFRAMNTVLCQQGALAHFGSDEQKGMYSYESEQQSENAVLRDEKATDESNMLCTDDSERAAKLKEATKKECVAMLTRADSEAKSITEKAKARASVILAEAKAEIEAQKVESAALITKAETEAKTIIDNAKSRESVIDAESKVKEEKAKEECIALLAKAERDAEGIIENARKRERVICADANVNIERQLARLLAAATEANKSAVALQNELADTYPNKYADDLLELYNIIADTKDSATDGQCRNNLESFMGAIEDMLYKYGFEAIRTKAGAAFDGKLHETARIDFDPKTACIEQSLRPGFMSKTKVLCKERVSVRK